MNQEMEVSYKSEKKEKKTEKRKIIAKEVECRHEGAHHLGVYLDSDHGQQGK